MDHQFEPHHHLGTVQSHQSFHPVQPTLIIERFLTVAHLPGTPLDLPTHHDTLSLIEEQHLLRYRMREGTAMMICIYLIHLITNTSHSICITGTSQTNWDPSGIQHADLFLPMFLFDIHAVIKPSDVIEGDEEYEKNDVNEIFID